MVRMCEDCDVKKCGLAGLDPPDRDAWRASGETGHNENLTFEVKFDCKCQCQSPPNNRDLDQGIDLVSLALSGDELGWRQAQNGVEFHF